MKISLLFPFLGAMAIMSLTAVSQAATIIAIDSAFATSTVGGGRGIDATIDGSLLSSSGASGDILTETVTNAGSSGHWLSDSRTAQQILEEELIFTLSVASDVDSIHIWPYVRGERDRGLKTFDISFSDDNGDTYFSTITAATLGDFVLPPGSTTTGEAVQSKTFASQSGVTDIKLHNLVQFGTNDYFALSEVRFSNVPEPSTTALLCLGGLALILRRRK